MKKMSRSKIPPKKHKRLPPHSWEPHHLANKGEANKTLVVAIVAVVVLVGLVLLLFVGKQFVGKAVSFGEIEAGNAAGFGAVSGSVKVAESFILPIKVNLINRKSVALAFSLKYDATNFNANCGVDGVFAILDKKFKGLDENNQPYDLTFSRKLTCANGLIEAEYSGMCADAECSNAMQGKETIAELKFTPKSAGEYQFDFTDFTLIDVTDKAQPDFIVNALGATVKVESLDCKTIDYNDNSKVDDTDKTALMDIALSFGKKSCPIEKICDLTGDGAVTVADGNMFMKVSPSCLAEKVCGDGATFAPEACDDGNTNEGDGCSATCTIEEGWTCTVGVGCSRICLDSDSAQDIFTKGTATGWDDVLGAFMAKEDFCKSGASLQQEGVPAIIVQGGIDITKNYVGEYSCTAEKQLFMDYSPCEDQCENGACVAKSNECPPGATCYFTQNLCAGTKDCDNGFCVQKADSSSGKCNAVLCANLSQVYVEGKCVDSKGVYTCICTKEGGCDSGYGYVSYYKGFVSKAYAEVQSLLLLNNKDWTCTLNQEPMSTVCDNNKSDVVGGFLTTEYTSYGYLKKASCIVEKSSQAPDVAQGGWLHSVSCDSKINVLSHGFTECNCADGACTKESIIVPETPPIGTPAIELLSKDTGESIYTEVGKGKIYTVSVTFRPDQDLPANHLLLVTLNYGLEQKVMMVETKPALKKEGAEMVVFEHTVEDGSSLTVKASAWNTWPSSGETWSNLVPPAEKSYTIK